MSQNIRPTPCSSGRHGSTANVEGSGIAIMSDSSIALKPVIEDPSKPIPASSAPSSSAALIENDLSCPITSVNHSRMKRIPRSATIVRTSSAVSCGAVTERGDLGALHRSDEPGARPLLQLLEGGRELLPLARERVLHAHRR